MAFAQVTESDILKAIVRRGAISDMAKDLQNPTLFGASPSGDKAALANEQLRLVSKIWTATNKLIRSQCNKDRIIDSLCFGSFGKTSVILDDPTAAKTYTYCPGPKTIFKLLENTENVLFVPQQVSP